MSSKPLTDAAQRGKAQYLPNPYLESGMLNPNSIRTYRRMHKITQKQLAHILGISEPTVSNVERGKRYSKATEEVLFRWMLWTRDIVEQYGVVPPLQRLDQYFELPDTVRKDWYQDLLIEVEERIVQLKTQLMHRDMQILELEEQKRDLLRYRVKDLTKMQTDMERHMRETWAEIEKLKEQIKEVTV